MYRREIDLRIRFVPFYEEEEPVSAATEYRYNRLTWPEMNEAIAMQKVVVLATGTIEQHAGPIQSQIRW